MHRWTEPRHLTTLLDFTKPMAFPAAVISLCFCVPYPVDLEIFRADDEYIVADVNRNNIVFRAQGDLFKLHAGGRMWDAAGYPVVTFRKKIMTAHSRWQVFRGNNIDSNHLLFSARKSSMLQVKTKLHVFLAINTAEDVCDFKMHKKSGKSSKFMVRVHPNMDYAFVVAIILILDRMNTSSSSKGLLETITAVGNIAGAVGQS
ncbi:Protein LURP-one-related 15 [Morella rubra]|uniref:Protein LURP-one-related 15 n=1 Tax=Morella rubra TaxID=262757 RepID=A0A6A1W9F6_9ROSI|nr:Protein LURP-one-related 15 [Morella rubra]